jgi:hypothetical protein
LQDPDIQPKVLWEGMAIIRPWDAIPKAVLAMDPHIYEDASIRNGQLDDEQKEVLQVSTHKYFAAIQKQLDAYAVSQHCLAGR